MADLIRDILLALWFFLPAGAANVVPIFAARIPGLRQLNAPIDGGLTFRGKRLFGEHKTWRGLAAGVVMAVLTLWLQQLLVRHTGWAAGLTAQVDYLALPTVVVGVLFGLGALGGDALESFFKRQRGIKPGHGWFPFDQLDYIIGGALATAPFIRLQLDQYVIVAVLWLAIHLVSSYIGYLMHVKERPI